MANARSQSTPPDDGEPVGTDTPADPTPPDVRAGDPVPAEEGTATADGATSDRTAAEGSGDTAVVEPVVVEPVARDERNAEPDAVDTAATRAAEPAASPRVVFVESPPPPRDRGNRGAGAALALLGAVVFALLYAIVAAILLALTRSADLFPASITAFLTDAVFWIPVLIFLVAFVLVVLLLNRAGWWAHVLGSLLVGIVTYFGSIGLLMIVNGAILMTGSDAAALFRNIATSPLVILAAVGAREVAIWMGLAIAARGRRVRARNAERRAAYERELAETRAERERAAAAST